MIRGVACVQQHFQPNSCGPHDRRTPAGGHQLFALSAEAVLRVGQVGCKGSQAAGGAAALPPTRLRASYLPDSRAIAPSPTHLTSHPPKPAQFKATCHVPRASAFLPSARLSEAPMTQLESRHGGVAVTVPLQPRGALQLQGGSGLP